MTPETPEWAALTKRLEKLEKQNARLKQIGGVVIVLLTSGLLMCGVRPGRTIEAEKFVLKDADGRVRATLGITEEKRPSEVERMFKKLQPLPKLALTLFDAEGHQRARLEENSLLLSDERWDRVRLYDLPLGGPGLELYDNKGDSLLSLGDIDGPVVSLRDGNGYQATLGVTNLETPRTGETHKTSAASVVLFDKDGKVLWKAP